MKSAHHRFAIRRAAAVRNVCRRRLQMLARATTARDGAVDLDVVSFSSHGYLPEQLMSIRSFLREAGTPASWTVVSDGTYTRRDTALLARMHPCVRVVDHTSFRRADLTNLLIEHATVNPKAAQLCTYLSLRPAGRPVLYTDSDVLFFPGARDLDEIIHDVRVPALYLPDLPGALTEAMLRDGESRHPVNSGFFVLHEPLDFRLALERFAAADPVLSWTRPWFEGQTVIHLAMHASGGAPLDDRLYVLQVDDERTVLDRYRSGEQRIRHYCPPVRYRFWLRAAPDVLAPRRASVHRRR
ncbi:MAG TPA: hypothetical protein VGO80_10720 [Solirubrobacteraceae bacterium]|nr:hypothetical protein [Solirubrobacteraceae bacterium]